MTKVKILAAGMVLCAAFSATAEAKLYKWVDEKGETHYGEVVPPEYADKDNVQLNSKGQAIKSQEAKKKEAAPAKKSVDDQAALDQRRRDSALINTYSNEKEIDLARDRNMQQVEARVNSAELRLKAAQANLDDHRKESEHFVKLGKNAPSSLQEDIADDEAKVVKLQQELSRNQEEAAAVKARYESDKIRYRELTGSAKK